MIKTIKKPPWSFYLGWVFSGMISFVITFPISWVLDVFVIDQIIGQTIVVKGVVHITEDYLFWYTFIPFFGIIIGILQVLLFRQKLARMGWWILTTTLGWSLVWLGIGFRFYPLGDIKIPSSIGYYLIAGTALGFLIGLT